MKKILLVFLAIPFLNICAQEGIYFMLVLNQDGFAGRLAYLLIFI